MEANVWVHLSEKGELVETREAHNVFTDHGSQALAQLAVWDALAGGAVGVDQSRSSDRLRWLIVGSGTQPERKSVTQLVAPLTLTTGPDNFLRALPAPTQPDDCSILYTVEFAGADPDLDHHGASVGISEAGLVFDQFSGSPGSLLYDGTSGAVQVGAYVSFPEVVKAQAQTLTLYWELRF